MFTKTAAMLTLAGSLLAAATAQAQYYDPYGRPPPPRYGYGYDRPPPPEWDYGRPPPPRWGYDRPPHPRFGEMCVTSRGTCYTRPGPVGAGCGCDIPGFGLKRGILQ